MRQSRRRLQLPLNGAAEDTYVRRSGFPNVLYSQMLPCSAFATRPLFSGSSASRAPQDTSSSRRYEIVLAHCYCAIRFALHKLLRLETRREPPALSKLLGLDFVTKSSSLVALHSWLIGIFYFPLMKVLSGRVSRVWCFIFGQVHANRPVSP